MINYLGDLIGHMHWANGRTLASLHETPEAAAVRLFAHVLTTEAIYLERIRGRDPWPQDFWPKATLDDCAELQADVAERYRRWRSGLANEDIARTARYRDSRGTKHETVIAEMVVHLALHGEHHRGQIARIVRSASGTVAMTDYITLARERT